MTALAIESIFGGLSVGAGEPEVGAFWQSLATVPKSFLPGIWLFFSLTYSRGNYRAVLARWRPLLVAAFVIPVGLSALSRAGLVGEMANVLNGLLLIATAMILMNLERTFRSAVGTMQWRIKFLILGLGIIFGARIYTCSQALLFSRNHLALINLETGALLLGCALMSVAYLRKGFSEIDVYPSHAVLQTSLTVLLVGGYLVVIGVLAQIASHTGEAQGFEIQAFVVLLGAAVLAVLLVSNRIRQNIQRFVSRHFKRPEHNFRKVWTDFTHATSSVLEQSEICAAAAKLISETFNALSVTIWLFDEEQQRLVLATTTSQLAHGTEDENPNFPATPSLDELRGASQPFDLEKAKKVGHSRYGKSARANSAPEATAFALHCGQESVGWASQSWRIALMVFHTRWRNSNCSNASQIRLPLLCSTSGSLKRSCGEKKWRRFKSCPHFLSMTLRMQRQL